MQIFAFNFVPVWISWRAAQCGCVPKPVEMRRIGDAEWRYFGSRTDAATAFGITTGDIKDLLGEPSTAKASSQRAEEPEFVTV